MKTKNLLMLLAIAGIMIFASCKKDESVPDPLTKTEAENAFNQAETNFNDIGDQIDSQTGMAVLNSFGSIGFPEAIGKAMQNESLSADDFKHMPSFGKGGSDIDNDYNPYVNFDFNSLKGTWTYSTGWSHTSEPTDKVVLIIPYGEGTATVTFSGYETKTLGENTYVSHLSAEYKISTQATPVMTWEYFSSKTLTGLSYKYVYTIGDYTKTKTFSSNGEIYLKTSPQVVTKSWAILWEKNGKQIFSKSFNKKAIYNDDQTFTVQIIGQYRILDIIVKWNVDYNQSTNLEDFPAFITITVWTADGAKVADIIFKTPLAKTGYTLYIKFNNGEEMPLSEYANYLYDALYSFTYFVRYTGESK